MAMGANVLKKVAKRGYLVFHRKRLEPKVLSWQQYSRCHFVSFVKCISGAKFEDHCSNISGDIRNSVFDRFSGNVTCVTRTRRVEYEAKRN